jgi:hypothetical protein
MFAVVHCSGLGLANRPWQHYLADWRVIGRFFADAGQR